TGDERTDGCGADWASESRAHGVGQGEEVAFGVTGVRNLGPSLGGVGEGRNHELVLGRPAAVDGRLVHPGALGHGFDTESLVPAVTEFCDRRVEHRRGVARRPSSWSRLASRHVRRLTQHQVASPALATYLD